MHKETDRDVKILNKIKEHLKALSPLVKDLNEYTIAESIEGELHSLIWAMNKIYKYNPQSEC